MYICYGYVLDTYPYICTIVINTYDCKSLEFDWKYLMFDFAMSIRVSFVLVGAGRMPRRCAATGRKVVHSKWSIRTFSCLFANFKCPMGECVRCSTVLTIYIFLRQIIANVPSKGFQIGIILKISEVWVVFEKNGGFFTKSLIFFSKLVKVYFQPEWRFLCRNQITFKFRKVIELCWR